MSTTAAESKKKYVREYQPKDEFGNAVGTLQRFEADTLEELADKLAAAHENASLDVYKHRKALKLGTLLEPDPEDPIPNFEEQALSADDRIAIANALSDANSSPDAVKKLLQSFGIPVDAIRRMLNDNEVQKRIRRGQDETQRFLSAHPEYVQTDANRDSILKYLEKRKLGITRKNLEIAYEDLRNEGLLVVQAPQQKKEEVPAPAPAVAAEASAPLPAIPAAATTEPTQIGAASSSAPLPGAATAQPTATAAPATPTSPRASQGATGLGRDNASVSPTPAPPKAKGISAQDIHRMSASDYAYALQNGLYESSVDDKGKKTLGRQLMTATEFRAAVEEMHKR